MPQVAIKESDIVGKWEHIDLSYKYAEQRTAVEMEFAADNTITSGPWKGGKWTYNEDSQILTANGVTLYLVYAGLGNHKTYWGKKIVFCWNQPKSANPPV